METKRRGLDFFKGPKSYIKANVGVLVALCALFLVLSITTDTFLTSSNMLNVLRQITTNVILACGMTFTLLTGGIDLAVGSMMALSSILTCGMIAKYNFPLALAIPLGLLIGIAMGFTNGFIIGKTKVPPFIVTLAMYSMARGGAYLYTNGQPIRVLEGNFNALTNSSIGPFPMPIIYMVVIFIVLVVVMNYTKFGRYVYAVGGNEEAAIFSGVPVAKTKILVYTISGLTSAIAGIMLASRMYTGQPSIGIGSELVAIASVILGGTSFIGGTGGLGGTIIGCLIIGVINNGLNMLKVSSHIQTILTGAIIMLAVYFDSLRSKKK